MRDDIYLKGMGKRIRAIRKSQKLSLQQLGAKCKVFYNVIGLIEKGYRDSHILMLKNIADNLNVDVKDFL